MSVGDVVACYHLAKNGAGVSIVPEFLAQDDLLSGKIQILVNDWELPSLEAFAEWPRNTPRQSLVDLFVRSLKR